MRQFLQATINVVMLGGMYALASVGLSLVYSTLRIIQFAHGQFIMLGGYALYYFYAVQGVNYFASLLIAGAIIGVASAGVERGFFRPVQGADLQAMVVGLGLLLLIEGVAQLVFGVETKFVPLPFRGVVNVGGLVIPTMQLVVITVALIMVSVLFGFLNWTKVGWATRAVADDPEAASLYGVNVGNIRTLGFSIGSAMAGMAGGLLVTVTALNPFIGGRFLIKAFIIVIVGGLGSLSGTVFAAFLLGAIEGYGNVYLGQPATLISFLLLILVLLLRPGGLVSIGRH